MDREDNPTNSEEIRQSGPPVEALPVSLNDVAAEMVLLELHPPELTRFHAKLQSHIATDSTLSDEARGLILQSAQKLQNVITADPQEAASSFAEANRLMEKAINAQESSEETEAPSSCAPLPSGGSDTLGDPPREPEPSSKNAEQDLVPVDPREAVPLFIEMNQPMDKAVDAPEEIVKAEPSSPGDPLSSGDPGPLADTATVAEPEVQSSSLDYLPPDFDPDLTSCFVTESRENLESAEASLLTLETNPDDTGGGQHGLSRVSHPERHLWFSGPEANYRTGSPC